MPTASYSKVSFHDLFQVTHSLSWLGKTIGFTDRINRNKFKSSTYSMLYILNYRVDTKIYSFTQQEDHTYPFVFR